MPTNFILPLSIVLGLLSFGLIAKWYLMPALGTRSRTDALIALIFPHCFRFIGLAFLIPGVTTVPLDPRFANPAAYGDLLAALLAFVAIFALRGTWKGAIASVWVFNVFGVLDLLNAVTQGIRYTNPGAMGATYFIPAILVPLLLVLHAVTFIILMRRDARKAA